MWKIAFSGFSEIPSLKFPWNSSFNDTVRLQWCTFCVFYAYTSHLVAIKKFGLLGLAKNCSKQGQIWPTDHYFTVVCGQITMKTFFAMIGLSLDSLVSFWCLGLKELKFGQSTGQILPRNAQGGINLTLKHYKQCSKRRSDHTEIDLKRSQECVFWFFLPSDIHI